MVAAGGRMVLAQLMLINHFLVSLSSTSSEAASFESAKMSPAEPSCAEGCALCSPVNGCLACNPSFALLLRRQGPRQTASCSRTCPRGFYRVSVDVYAFCRKCTMLGCVSCEEVDLCTACDRGYENIFGSCVYRGEETTIDPETSTLQPLQQDLNHASSRTFASTTTVPTSTSTSSSATSPLPIPNTLFSEPLTNPPIYETRYHSVAEMATSQTDGVSATWGATGTPTAIANEFTDVAIDASIRGGGEGEGGGEEGEGGGGEEGKEEEEEGGGGGGEGKEEEEEGGGGGDGGGVGDGDGGRVGVEVRVEDGGEVDRGGGGDDEGEGEDGGGGGGREEVGIGGGGGRVSSERTTSARTSTNPNVPGVASEETTTKTTLGFPTAPNNDHNDHSGGDDPPATEGTPTTTTPTKVTDAHRAAKACRSKWRVWRERYRKLFCRVAEKRKKAPRHCKHRRKMCQRHRHSRGKHKASAGGQKKALEKQQATCGSLRADAPLAATAAAAALGCWGVAAALGSRWL